MRLLWIGLLAAGCAEQLEPVEPEDNTPIEDATTYTREEDLQCRDLLGPKADTLTNRAAGEAYASFPLNQGTNQLYSIDVHGRISPPSGTLLNGRVLTGTATGAGKVRVKFVSEATFDEFGATYRLQFLNASNQWEDYCEPGETATALKGRWKTTAFRIPAEEVTFGCSDSAMKKCYGFGYAPDDGAVATLDYDLASVRWRAHQACTRMARADYCGNGEPGTRPGTPIGIRDNIPNAFNPPPWEVPPAPGIPGDPLLGAAPVVRAPTDTLAPPDKHYYESEWTWRENRGAVCLERDRWKSVSALSCPHLPDPRVDPTAQFCSEMTFYPYESSASVRLANTSMTQDMFLNRWVTPTGQTVATVRGFWRAKLGGGHHANPKPFPGEAYDTQVATDGILLRNPPHDTELGGLVPVFSTKSGTDRVLATVPGMPKSDLSFEGYVLVNRTGNMPYGTYEQTLKDGSKDTVTGTPVSGLTAPTWTPKPTGGLHHVFMVPSQPIP